MRGLLSVVTPTYNRPELLAETIRHLREQDYPKIEHLIVSDGQDRHLRLLVEEQKQIAEYEGHPEILFQQLGRNFTTEGPANSFGIGAITAGFLMARGEYVAVHCDDERCLVPDHYSKLIALLEETCVELVYPLVRIWRNGDPDGPETAIIGTDPPEYCQITHYVARTSLFRKAMPAWGSHPVDWSIVRDWIADGATWAMLPEITFSHRLDQP
jgi:glycosyltransferase involved in cell wall biosynthesis